MDSHKNVGSERQHHSPYRGFVAGIFSGIGKLTGWSHPIMFSLFLIYDRWLQLLIEADYE